MVLPKETLVNQMIECRNKYDTIFNDIKELSMKYRLLQAAWTSEKGDNYLISINLRKSRIDIVHEMNKVVKAKIPDDIDMKKMTAFKFAQFENKLRVKFDQKIQFWESFEKAMACQENNQIEGKMQST